jgi:uncharacterized protein YkwD
MLPSLTSIGILGYLPTMRLIVAVALLFIAACNSQGASSLLPDHAREVLGGQPAAAAPAATIPSNDESASATASSDSWLARINYYRAMAGLDPVAKNSKMSDGDVKHARYMVKNYVGRTDLGLDMHLESKSNQWYTGEGSIAGRTSDVIPPGGIELTDKQAIDLWVAGPFHRLPILNPSLKEAGFGSFSEDGESAIALQLRKPSALEDSTAFKPAPRSYIRPDRSGEEDESSVSTSRVVEFPPANAIVPLAAFDSAEWPNPLASCPGYKAPTGIPITLQLGGPTAPKIQSATLTTNQQPLESCSFDASNYRGDDETQTVTGRGALQNFGAIVLIPRARLHSGASYEVSIVVDGKSYQWTFQVGGH